MGIFRRGNISNAHGYREVEDRFKEYGTALESRSDRRESEKKRKGSLSLKGLGLFGRIWDPLEVSEQLGDMLERG